jgi:hypothetical protein
VPAGVNTITETAAKWYSVTGITQLPGQNYIVPGSISLPTGTVQVTVAAGTAVDAVTYTDALVTGYVEVCKATPTGSGLTGTFGFALSSALASGPNATATYKGTASATVGACSSPIQVPAGSITATENGTNLYVTAITADFNGIPANNALTASSLPAGIGTATVTASANVSNQTDIYFTDDVVVLKVCKAWSGTGAVAGTTYPFTVTPGVNPNGQGPVPAAWTASLQVGQCSNPVAYAPGTPVTVTEGITAGTKVQGIANTGSLSTNTVTSTTVPPVTTTLLDLVNRSTTVTMGNLIPSLGGTTYTNEGLVTFTNELADPGTLKVCKVAGTGTAPIGTMFNFVVTVPGTTPLVTYPVSVPLGQCEYVLNPITGNPQTFPYNGTVNVTETGSPSNIATGISAVPSVVTELRGPTTEPTVTGTSLGVIGGASSANVTISENDVTEVTWADIDPPVVTNPGDPGTGTTTTNGGSADSSGNNSQSTSTGSTGIVTIGGVAVAVPTSNAVTPSVKSSTTKVVLTKAQTAKLAKLQKELASDKALVKSLSTKHFATKSAMKAAAKKISALKAQEKVLNREIALLK